MLLFVANDSVKSNRLHTALVIYFILPFIPMVGSMIAGVIDGLTSGLTDLPYALAVGTSILEGSLVGAVFGGFIGSLKYKHEGGGSKAPKVKKSKSIAQIA